MNVNPYTVCVCVCTYASLIHGYLCLVTRGVVMGGTSNDRLWGGLNVCVVSDSKQGVSSMSERQRPIDRVIVWHYVCNERSTTICEGLWSCPVIPLPKICVPNLFSPQDSKDLGALLSDWVAKPFPSTPPHSILPHLELSMPDTATFTSQHNCEGG